MGISIHYSGRISNKQRLPQLIKEIQEIATVHNWKSQIYEREFPIDREVVTLSDSFTLESTHDGNLYGIDFTPEGCEPVSVCFLRNGRMSSIMQLTCWGDFKEEQHYTVVTEEWDASGKTNSSTKDLVLDQTEFNRMLYLCSTKTQFAGPNTHEFIIGVLRYISNNFLSDFELLDEGEFWETGDTGLLKKNFIRNGFLIDSFSDGLTNTPRLPGEDIESFIRRIASKINKKQEEE